MIVCLCDGATHRDVQDAIDDGAMTLADFMRRRIGSGCGSCHGMLLQMVRASHAAAPAAVVASEETLSANA